MTSFNIVLFTSVDDVKAVKEKMKEEGAHEAQTAHFFIQISPGEVKAKACIFLIYLIFSCALCTE